MEILDDDLVPKNVRVYKTSQRRVLKNGTVKIYTYNEKYTPKSNVVVCNKNIIHKKITDCKDKEKLTSILEILIEMGL